jgi:hypothetical protein
VATSASTLYAFDAQDPTTRVWGPVTLVLAVAAPLVKETVNIRTRTMG